MSKTSKLFSKLFLIVLLIKAFDVFKNLVIASLLGVSDNADIYASLIIIPDSLIVLLGLDTIRGVVNSEYAHFYTKGEISDMWNSFNNLTNFLFWISLVVVIIVLFFNAAIIGVLLPGFIGDKKMKAIEISFIIFPIVFFKVFIGYFHSVYNSVKSFFLPVIYPVIISVFLLISVLLPYYNNEVIFNISIANLIGNIVLFILMLTGLKKIGAAFKFKKPFLDPISTKILKGSSTILVLVICNQLYLFSRNFFASYFGEGAVSALHYSGTITSVIISMIFAVFFTVLISNLSSFFSDEQVENARTLYLQTMSSLLFVLIPAVILFIVYGKEILSVVFLRGNFTQAGIEMTTKPFFWDALSLITFILYIIPTALFLAKKEYKILARIGSVVYLAGIAINYILSSYFGFYAISMATFFVTGIYGILLILFSQKLIGKLEGFSIRVLMMLFSGLISYSLLTLFKTLFFSNFISDNFQNLLLIIFANLLILVVIYLFTTTLFKVNFTKELIKSMKK
ncbi:MAG: lipid II flippase MurJ [Ignavibacteria bacterium]